MKVDGERFGMGVFRQAREANRLGKEWARLYDLPSVYRPDEPEARRSIANPDLAAHNLADVANELGLTAGDALVLGVEVVTRSDSLRDAQAAVIELIDEVNDGRLRTIDDGGPMNQFVSLAGVALVAKTALSMARPEASIEHSDKDPGLKELRAYVEDLEGSG